MINNGAINNSAQINLTAQLNRDNIFTGSNIFPAGREKVVFDLTGASTENDNNYAGLDFVRSGEKIASFRFSGDEKNYFYYMSETGLEYGVAGGGTSISSGYQTLRSGFLYAKASGNNRNSSVSLKYKYNNPVEVFSSTWDASYGSPDCTFIPIKSRTTITFSGLASAVFFEGN